MGPTREQLEQNRILRAIPADELATVEGDLVAVDLAHGDVLFAADEPIQNVWFPLDGAVSMIAETAEGHATDVTIVGSEGFVDLAVFLGTGQLPFRAVTQVPGSAIRLPTRSFVRLLERSDTLNRMLRRYTQMRIVEMGQTILCNRVHPINERTARWLLHIDERVGQAPFELTQDFFAIMLGVTRPSVTIAAGELRAAGLIDYTRGVIEVLDRDGLEAAACDCYRVIRTELERLVDTENPTEPGAPASR